MSEEKAGASFFSEILQNALNKDVDAAIAEQLALVELDPANPKRYCALGAFFQMQGRLEDAGLMFRRALELDPNFALAHQYLGQLLVFRGEMEAAWHHAREAARCGNRTLLDLLTRWRKSQG